MKKSVYVVFFVFFVAVFLVSSYFLLTDLSERLAAKKEYADLGLVEIAVENPFMANKQIDELKTKNSDTVGRILIDNTNIDYPVVQSGDNAYYLNHSFSKAYNSSGCIFMDYRCDPNFSEAQTILYGHKMITGTMFNNLNKFKTSAFMNEKNKITIYTSEKTLIYEAIVTVITKKGAEFITLEMPNGKYLDKCYASAAVRTSESATDADRLLILFTCDGDDEDGRELVIAKLISETFVVNK